MNIETGEFFTCRHSSQLWDKTQGWAIQIVLLLFILRAYSDVFTVLAFCYFVLGSGVFRWFPQGESGWGQLFFLEGRLCCPNTATFWTRLHNCVRVVYLINRNSLKYLAHFYYHCFILLLVSCSTFFLANWKTLQSIRELGPQLRRVRFFFPIEYFTIK